MGDGVGGGAGRASLLASTVDRPRGADAELCIRAGYVALRWIADFFDIRHNPDPHWPEEPISIDRRKFDQVCRQLAEAGVPLKDDLDQVWRDFAGPGPDRAARRGLTCRASEHSSWNGRRQGWAWMH